MKTQLKNEMIISREFFEKKIKERPNKKNEANDYCDVAYPCAVIALDRIIPKKPIDKSGNPTDWHIMGCPTCNRTFWNSGDFVHYTPHYCEKCGQAIDWSEDPLEEKGDENENTDISSEDQT